MLLHYINESAFFFFIAVCMTFTDFVSNIPTRTKTASMLTTFMFVILGLNILVCIIGIIISKKHLCFPAPATEETQQEVVKETSQLATPVKHRPS